MLAILGNNLVTWRSKKLIYYQSQAFQAEFQALSSGIDDMLWIQEILKKLQIPCEAPIKVFYDNKSAVCLSHDLVNHNCTKHVEIDWLNIKEKLKAKVLCIVMQDRRGESVRR